MSTIGQVATITHAVYLSVRGRLCTEQRALLAYCEMDSLEMEWKAFWKYVPEWNMTMAVNALDPGAIAKIVLVFRRGHSFDKLDRDLLRSHDGAVMIPVGEAKCWGLMHCEYSVMAV